jgi:transcriptional regulator with XRE-family HTH domain
MREPGSKVLLRMAIERQLAAQRLGARLAKERARLGLNQEDAARKIGVTHRAYQRWESGDAMPFARNLRSAAEAFGLDVGELAGGLPQNGDVQGQLDRIEAKLDHLIVGLSALPLDTDLPALEQPQEPRGSAERRRARRN